jgi:uncharacterized membrane protein
MKRFLPLLILIVILLLATFLRFHRLENQSFWHDEGNSARLSERSITLIIAGTASDIHPPLYYLLLRGWRELVGSSEFALRSFSAFLGVTLVAFVFSLGRQLLGSVWPYGAIAGALLTAANPALIYYSQEARMYEMLAFLALLSTLLLIRILQAPDWRSSLVVAYVLTVAAGLYTHYFFPAVLLGQNLIFLIWLFWWRPKTQINTIDSKAMAIIDQGSLTNKGRYFAGWAGIMFLILLIYAPWLPIFIRQATGKASSRVALPSFLLESGKWLAFGPTIELEAVLIPLLSYGLAVGLGLYIGRKIFRKSVSFTIILLISISLPVTIMWLVGTTKPAFNKFLLVAIPPLCLAAGVGLWSLWQHASIVKRSILVKVLTVILAGFIFWGTGRSLQNMYYDPTYARADYRSIAAKIAAESRPDSAVILNAANQWEVFTYYYSDDSAVFPVPRGHPEPQTIDDELRAIVNRYDHVYALFWGEAERDPERLVERWLDANAFKSNDEWVGDVRFVTYAVASEETEKIDVPVNVSFGESITLNNFVLGSEVYAPGEIIQLTLHWQTEERLEKRYKVFLHLIDQSGHIISQRDSEPGGGLALTTTWSPGEILADNHGVLIPSGTSPGQYTLIVGLYDIADPEARLSIEADGGAIDAFRISTITIVGD